MKKLLLAFVLALTVAFCSIIPSCVLDDEETWVTVLHTNDFHSNLDAAPFLATAIARARTESENGVLLFDAGDFNSDSLYATLFQGETETWLANHLGYDAMCPGNHEFDNGSAWLAGFINSLDMPVVCTNIILSEDSPLASSLIPYTIIECDGIEYGVLGIISSDTAALSSPGADVEFYDEIIAAAAAVSALENAGVERIFALTHQGWARDLELAARVPGIDVVIGGHTHTVPEQYPAVIIVSPAPALIVQAGSQGSYLGQLKISFDENGIIQNWKESRLITIDNTIAPDINVTTYLESYQQIINEYKTTNIGTTGVLLNGERELVRSEETNLGNAIADAFLAAGSPAGASIALVTGGGIRASLPAGNITLGDVMEVLPFCNHLVVMDITGQQLLSALENGVSEVDQVSGRFPQVAGLRFTWDPQAKPGTRIISVEIETENGNYEPVDPEAIYRLVTTDFLAGGGDGYDMFTGALNTEMLEIIDYQAFADYIKNNSPLKATVEGRITRVSD